MSTSLKHQLWLSLLLLFPWSTSLAQQPGQSAEMREDDDGDLRQGEFVRISPNGSITRALCPYSCEMRGLPVRYCKTWRSQMNPDECYVQDTRIQTDAVRFSSE